jgi:uncharacterized damage-inducible protein DinB
MTENTLKEHLIEELLWVLEETFENVHGLFLDRGTSLFETLSTITAEQASQPVSDTCASIAAHVEHMTFYLETAMRYMKGIRPTVDWTEIWRTVREVSPDEWASSQNRLRESYQRARTQITNETWDDKDNIGGAIGLIAHSAYHLGEIRQALCTIKPPTG